MARIKITPEQVRGVSNEFNQASGQSQEMVTRLTSSIQTLSTDWEGMTKERFYNEFTQWQNSMKQFVTLLQGISKQLEQIAGRFETVDQG